MPAHALSRWPTVAPPVVGLVRPVRIDPDGVAGPTRGQAAGRWWTRVGHGWYVPVDAPRHLVEQRILEQSVRLPRHGAVTGWAACRLLGGGFFDGYDDSGTVPLRVPLNVGPHRSLPGSPHVDALNHVLRPTDRTERHGIPTVVGARATYDAVRDAGGLRAGVKAIDMMAAAGLCSRQMLREYSVEQPQDYRTVLRAEALASEHALSPPEVDVRLVMELDLGLAQPVVNGLVHDLDGRVVALCDLIDMESGVVVEVDGAQHREGRQRGSDLRRKEVLEALGLPMVQVTGSESRLPRLVGARIARALSVAPYEPLADRRWFVRRPADTLHDRLTENEAWRGLPSA